jgi:hypothetical protein
VVGIQAQLSPAMLLALRARVDGLEVADVDAAIAETRSLVRTWAMRGTLHLLAAEDFGWLIDLLGPVFMRGDTPRLRQLGLDAETVERGLRAMPDILAPGEAVTRDVIVERLNARGFSLDRKTQAPIHLIAQAALAGVLALGPEASGGKSTYALADGWLAAPADAIPREAALAGLARRYVSGYGPADLADFAAWSGLPMADAKIGWVGALVQGMWTKVTVEGRSLWVETADLPAARADATIIRLLPAFDDYVLGYKDRRHVVAPERQPEVYHGGQTVPVVMVDGLAAGVWRAERSPKRLSIDVRAFARFDSAAERLIRAEADDIARLWRLPVAVEISAAS